MKRKTPEPIIITHDSTATWDALVELKKLLVSRPQRLKEFRKRFSLFQDCFIYERISALRANRCTAGFQLTRELGEFIAAVRASKPEDDSSLKCGTK